MSISFWGAMLALPLGHFLFRWLANHEDFTRKLVKLLAGMQRNRPPRSTPLN